MEENRRALGGFVNNQCTIITDFSIDKETPEEAAALTATSICAVRLHGGETSRAAEKPVTVIGIPHVNRNSILTFNSFIHL